MRALAALAFAILCAVTAAPASAQARGNSYTVAGVPADATAENSAQAQALALQSAQRIGFDRLVRRLTLPDELQRLGAPQPDQTQLEALVSSVDVNDERRSGTRYIARVTLRFDPAGMRAVLRNRGLTVVDTRTAPVLVVPQSPGASDAIAQAWQEAWTEGGFGDELVPLAVAPPGLDNAPPDWVVAQPAAAGAAAGAALFATLRTNGNSLAVTLVEVGPTGPRRDRGVLQGRVTGGDAGLRPALAALAAQASERLQGEWKTRAAAAGATRARVSASALYQQQSEWEAIKSALEASAATLISEIRIEAVGRNGALVSFSYIGEQGQLVTELRRHGVSLENASIGPVLRVARN